MLGRKRPRRRLHGWSVLVSLLFLLVPEAQAHSCRASLIPQGGVFSCSNCHVSSLGGGTRTPFGNDVFLVVSPGSCLQFWGPALAAKDSDGDGRTNGEELHDPEGAWRPGIPQPGDRTTVTNPGIPNREFIRGDANVDGAVTLADVVTVVGFLFRQAPLTCQSAADANNDASIDLSDTVLLLFHLFGGQGVKPPAPFPACGFEVVTDRLTCTSFSLCP